MPNGKLLISSSVFASIYKKKYSFLVTFMLGSTTLHLRCVVPVPCRLFHIIIFQKLLMLLYRTHTRVRTS